MIWMSIPNLPGTVYFRHPGSDPHISIRTWTPTLIAIPDRHSYPRLRTWNLSLPENPLWAWCILALEYPSLIDPYMKSLVRITRCRTLGPTGESMWIIRFTNTRVYGLPQNAGFSQIVTSTSRARVEYSGQPLAWASLPVSLSWSLFNLRLSPRSLVITY